MLLVDYDEKFLFAVIEKIFWCKYIFPYLLKSAVTLNFSNFYECKSLFIMVCFVFIDIL